MKTLFLVNFKLNKSLKIHRITFHEFVSLSFAAKLIIYAPKS